MRKEFDTCCLLRSTVLKLVQKVSFSLTDPLCLVLQPAPKPVENSGPATPEDEEEEETPPPPIATRPDKTKSIVCIINTATV